MGPCVAVLVDSHAGDGRGRLARISQDPLPHPSIEIRTSYGPSPCPSRVPWPRDIIAAATGSGHSGNSGAFAVPAFFLFTGISARLRDVSRRLGRAWFFTVGIYGLLFSLIGFILDLPLAYYHGYVRPHAYGLSNQISGQWFGNALKGLGIEMIGMFLLLWVPYLLIARSPRRWWLYTRSWRSRSCSSRCWSRRSGSTRCSTTSGR